MTILLEDPRTHKISVPVAQGTFQYNTQNRMERMYDHHLELRMKAGHILWYLYEGITLKLACNTRYTPDFIVMMKDRSIECHEVRGFWGEEAFVKIKVAASLFPFRFFAARRTMNSWDITSIK